jgi:hypothetical protein
MKRRPEHSHTETCSNTAIADIAGKKGKKACELRCCPRETGIKR